MASTEQRSVETPLVIDIHTHTFNADDVPVRGFLHRVAFDHAGWGAEIAKLVDLLIQGRAPGYAAERAKLDRLLGGQPFEAAYRIPEVDDAEISATLEAEVDEALAMLQVQHPALVARLGAELQVAEEHEDAIGQGMQDEGMLTEANAATRPSFVRRAIRWVILFGRSRFDITRALLEAFDLEVDLFCPMLVDLDSGLGDTAPTTLCQQVELHEKISRLSMLGLMPSRADARVHPFAAFDPRREVRARLAKDIATPFELVKEAITRYGFIGVKVYPPMGWRPIGNKPSLDMTAMEARELDSVLRDFYGWCEKEHVPITAHCNATNFADPLYKDFASPAHWLPVLRAFPDLRVNLGHFGGARATEPQDGWPWQIARATPEHAHLYADVGNHSLHDDRVTGAYFRMLKQMFDDSATASMRDRVMLGSDWYMAAIHPDNEQFLSRYFELYEQSFGRDNAVAFAGTNARSFLGFDDATNRNCRRLVARYQHYAPQRQPTWLATE